MKIAFKRTIKKQYVVDSSGRAVCKTSVHACVCVCWCSPAYMNMYMWKPDQVLFHRLHLPFSCLLVSFVEMGVPRA